MERQSTKISIIGAGFSGTALAATLHRHARQPIEITLIDKTGQFGAGFAYSTPYLYHLLNVRAKDMSAFEDQPNHFVDWLHANDMQQYLEASSSIAEQFVPRLLYGKYLQALLRTITEDKTSPVTLKLVTGAVTDIIPQAQSATLHLQNGTQITADKVVLALGNGSPSAFPFPVTDVQTINNPWDYTALKVIPAQDPVMIVGTGLSMIDAILTLHHQQHQGAIYALSRHGLLPLPHNDNHETYNMPLSALPNAVPGLIRHLRQHAKEHMASGGDWRSVINELRAHLPALWRRASVADKKLFFRHLMPYWNIHRHRVHVALDDLLTNLAKNGQLKIIAGRVLQVEKGQATINVRHTPTTQNIPVKWLINCMGPSLNLLSSQPLASCLRNRNEACFDALNLGFMTTPQGALETPAGISSLLYSLGPPTKGTTWECMAVPGIRKQVSKLAEQLFV